MSLGGVVAYPSMANTPHRYFINDPKNPTVWEEVSIHEFRALLACLEANLEGAEAEGFRFMSLPADAVPTPPFALSLMNALFTLITLLPPPGQST